MSLFDIVKTLCDKHGDSIASFERKNGFANGSVKKWANAYPSGDRIAKTAQYFNVSTDYLLGLTDTPAPSASLREDEEALLKVYNQLVPNRQEALFRQARVQKAQQDIEDESIQINELVAKGGESKSWWTEKEEEE